MKLPLLAVAALGLAAGLGSTSVRLQTPPLADYPVRHIGIIVPSLAEASKHYRESLGIEVPPIREASNLKFPDDYTGDPAAHPKYLFLQFPNIQIELVEPVGGKSPWRNHLDAYGASLQHIAFSVPDVPQAVQYLVKRGGKQTAGSSGSSA